MTFRSFYADFHIHIGRTESGRPVKISGSRNLTFFNIVREAAERKGMDMIGLIDCHVPEVLAEMRRYLQDGILQEQPDGGLKYKDMGIMIGSEIELKETGRKPFHVLVYLATVKEMADFSEWMRPHMSNLTLSSQRLYVPARTLQEEVSKRGGLFIPAHIFTPFKSVYGSAADRISDVLDPSLIAAVELGLSADTLMASQLSELDRYPFLTNSDAHSLGKIAREYNRLRLKSASFNEWALALKGLDGRRIEANYGLNPRLGKYHLAFCRHCNAPLPSLTSFQCPACGGKNIVRGVEERIRQIADRPPEAGNKRPPYFEQIPLEFIPGLGKKTLERLLDQFGTEMNILHRTPVEELERAVGSKIAGYIQLARTGRLQIEEGGGGRYGKIADPT